MRTSSLTSVVGMFVVAGMLFGLVAGCGGATPTEAPAATEPATAGPAPTAAPASPTPEEEPAAGGDLVIAMDGASEPALLDAQIDPFHETALIDSFLTDSLVCRDANQEIKPWLATDWEISDDNLTWTFHLREDVQFQDGTPFNAEAVKYNLERILAPETQSVEAAARLGSVKSVDVLDEYTVAVTHERAFAPFLDAHSSLFIPMWSPAALEKYGYDEFPQHLVGTGPFIFKENVPKDHITMVRNPDYNWAPACVDHEGPALLDSLTLKWVTEASVRAEIVKTGEAQVALLPPEHYAMYTDDPNYEVVIGYQPGSGMLWMMNSQKAPVDDILVRQAIMHAVDRDTINNVLYEGTYLVTYGPMAPNSACYWEGAETMYPYDPEQSRALLDEAGWTLNPNTGIREKDGQPLDIRWTALHHGEIGEVLKAQLQEVGINLIVEVVAAPMAVDMGFSRDFDLMYGRLRSDDPVFLYMHWHSRNSEPGGWAWTDFKDARLDQLLDDAGAVLDLDQRCEYYEEAQKIIMENAITVGILSEPKYYVVDKSVKGFQLGATALIYYPYMLRLED